MCSLACHAPLGIHGLLMPRRNRTMARYGQEILCRIFSRPMSAVTMESRPLKSSAQRKVRLLPMLPNGKYVDVMELGSFSLQETGGVLWAHSASALCNWLLHGPGSMSLAGAKVLELGAGTGAVGIFAAAMGASSVTLTDGGSAALLELAARNVEANRWPKGPVPVTAEVRVEALRWGSVADAKAFRGADWVLASDVIALRAQVCVLCDTIVELLEVPERPRIVIAHERRTDYDEQFEFFEAEARRRGLDVEVLSTESMQHTKHRSGRCAEVYVIEVLQSTGGT